MPIRATVNCKHRALLATATAMWIGWRTWPYLHCEQDRRRRRSSSGSPAVDVHNFLKAHLTPTYLYPSTIS